jgi:hypothetical protein
MDQNQDASGLGIQNTDAAPGNRDARLQGRHVPRYEHITKFGGNLWSTRSKNCCEPDKLREC